MNGDYTRIGLDEEREGSRTDWARLRALTDAEIDGAIATDPDAYSIEDSDVIGRPGGSYAYQIYRDAQGKWRWALRSADGEVLAISGHAFDSRQAARSALTDLREAILGAHPEAA